MSIFTPSMFASMKWCKSRLTQWYDSQKVQRRRNLRIRSNMFLLIFIVPQLGTEFWCLQQTERGTPPQAHQTPPPVAVNSGPGKGSRTPPFSDPLFTIVLSTEIGKNTFPRLCAKWLELIHLSRHFTPTPNSCISLVSCELFYTTRSSNQMLGKCKILVYE